MYHLSSLLDFRKLLKGQLFLSTMCQDLATVSEKMFLSKRSLKAGSRVLIVDDFLKNGGTINGMISLLSEFDSTLVGVAVFAENKGDCGVANYKSLLAVTDINVRKTALTCPLGNIFE